MYLFLTQSPYTPLLIVTSPRFFERNGEQECMQIGVKSKKAPQNHFAGHPY